MLNKKACSRCIFSLRSPLATENMFNYSWENGHVYCPARTGYPSRIYLIKDDPPNDCPYILEHLVSQGAMSC
jgi:hypothetical protein